MTVGYTPIGAVETGTVYGHMIDALWGVNRYSNYECGHITARRPSWLPGVCLVIYQHVDGNWMPGVEMDCGVYLIGDFIDDEPIEYQSPLDDMAATDWEISAIH